MRSKTVRLLVELRDHLAGNRGVLADLGRVFGEQMPRRKNGSQSSFAFFLGEDFRFSNSIMCRSNLRASTIASHLPLPVRCHSILFYVRSATAMTAR
jgi:hypothetical protein